MAEKLDQLVELVTIEDITKLGFNQAVIPTLDMVKNWIRENFIIDVNVRRNVDGWDCSLIEFAHGNKCIFTGQWEYEDYNRALEHGIRIAIQIIKNKK